MIAVGADTTKPDYDYAQNVTVKAYCLKEGAAWEMQDGNCVVSFEKSGDVICLL